MMQNKPADSQATGQRWTVFVTGATGNVGTAAVRHLLKTYPHVNVIAGVRDIEKAKETLNCSDSRLKLAQIDVKGDNLTGDKEKDSTLLKFVDALIVVPPSAFDNRVGMSTAYIDAARGSGVKHLVMISAPIAEKPDTIFGKDFSGLEKRAHGCGVPGVTILRSVFFFENQEMNADSIKNNGTFSAPCDGSKPIPFVAVCEVGEAAANAAVDNTWKGVRTCTLAGDVRSFESMSVVYSKSLGKMVKYNPATDKDATKAMSDAGLPNNIAKAFVELHRDFEQNGSTYKDTDLRQLLRREPEHFEGWMASHTSMFQTASDKTGGMDKPFVMGGNKTGAMDHKTGAMHGGAMDKSGACAGGTCDKSGSMMGGNKTGTMDKTGTCAGGTCDKTGACAGGTCNKSGSMMGGNTSSSMMGGNTSGAMDKNASCSGATCDKSSGAMMGDKTKAVTHDKHGTIDKTAKAWEHPTGATENKAAGECAGGTCDKSGATVGGNTSGMATAPVDDKNARHWPGLTSAQTGALGDKQRSAHPASSQ